jgi:hypothetical protein
MEKLRVACTLLWSPLLLATAAAQTRAPFTGTVLGLDGKPLANAQVVCAWQPQEYDFGTAERCETKTDAQGRFVLDLAVGKAAFVWAIGPADAKGESQVVLPRTEGAGGKEMDLRADLRLARVSLQVTGTTPWLAEGPLALRIGVAAGMPLGPDIAIPGDGPVQLPPLPSDLIQVALVDGRRNVLDLQQLDIRERTAIAFPELREFDVRVASVAGGPIAGVRLLLHGQAELPPADRTGVGSVNSRVVATTDAEGKAHCRIPWGNERSTMLFAERTGYAGMLSGWFRGERLENGKISTDDPEQALGFELSQREATKVRIVGAARDKTQVRFTGYALVRAKKHEGGVPVTFATTGGQDGEYCCEGPTATDFVTAHVSVSRDQPVPHLTLASSSGKDTRLPDVDLGALRTCAVQVVDDAGNAVPCVALGITHQGQGEFHPLAQLVTNRDGRAEVRMADANLVFYASTTTHYGIAILKAESTNPVRIVMRRLATMKVRVVDAQGAPMVGARIELKRASGVSDKPKPGESEEAHALACLTIDAVAHQRLRDGRTNLSGEVLVPFLDTSTRITVEACHGTRRSDVAELCVTDEVRVLTMR